ncbi:DUF3089 domain-containing protein [Hydrotalea sp.]|uniref:DUF3089 domain-containing protein n=3 Tax=Hydrotalea sp. TaxID=2881279 RepID=UPI0026168F0D|nr:DUF3089 domain-containing protein [Hydrotalea sp.]
MRYLNISLLLFLFACNHPYYKMAKNYPTEAAYSFNTAPDYNNLNDWAAHPYKNDPADSVPKPLKPNYHPDSLADVFFIHPTTYTEKEKSFGWNAPLHDAVLNAKTDYSTILYQASIFNAAGRVFAPRYRQAHLSAYFPKTGADSLQAIAAFQEAYSDVKAAFEYYLQHFNQGRPIIIASHSQGSTHAIRLLKEFFDGKPLQQQLVAAYIVGMPVAKQQFKTIRACATPQQTGCICSWRSFKEGYTPAYVNKEHFQAIVTNPLTWRADVPDTSRFANEGAVLKNFNRVIPHVVNAAVEKNILWMQQPKFFGSFLLHTKNYHIADFNFFYMNVRENVVVRKAALLAQKNKALLKNKAILLIHTPN